MPRNVNYSVFKGGLNEAKNERTLDPTEASELMNVEFTKDGSIIKCKGYILKNLVALNSENENKEITGVYEFILSTKASYLIVCCGNKVYVGPDENNLTEAYSGITEGKKWQFATFFDYAIFVNGYDKPLLFNGSTVEVAPWWTDKNYPSLVTVWKNRLWMSGSPTAPYFVWHSAAGTAAGISFLLATDAIGTPFESNYGGIIPVNTNDGQQITSLGTFYNRLIIYKTKSIHMIDGDSAIGSGGINEFSVIPINQSKGCVAPNSLVNIYNDMFYIDESGINRLSLSQGQNQVGNIIANSISNKVSQTIAGWNNNLLKNAFTIHYENKKQVWFVFPDGSSLENNKVLVLDYSDDGSLTGTPLITWTLRSGFSASCGTYYKGKPLLGGYNGFLQQHDTSYSYAGQPIEAYWASSWLSFGSSTILKHLISMDVTLELLGNFDLDVECYWDYQGVYTKYAINQKAKGASLWGDAQWGVSTWSAPKVVANRPPARYGWGKVFKVKFKNIAANQPFRILGFDIVYDTYQWQPEAKSQ